MRKLVRDGYEGIQGVEAAPLADRNELLRAKLHEELREIDESMSEDELLQELADLIEVAYAFFGEILTTSERMVKLKYRGGFDKTLTMDAEAAKEFRRLQEAVQ